MDVRLVLLVGLGGAIGSMLRYLATEIIPSNDIPYGTISVNLVGSMFLGIMFGAIAADVIINQNYILLFGTGVLGAFTTMSAFAMDTVTLSEDELSKTVIYIMITIVGSIGFAWLGYKLGFSLLSWF